MPETASLIVRRNARVDVALQATINVAGSHVQQVRLAAAEPAGGTGSVEVGVIDLSAGGMGFLSPVFLPRRCLLEARVRRPGDDGAPVLTCTLRVHRVVMTDRRPAYLIGARFDQETDESRAQVRSLLRAFGLEA